MRMELYHGSLVVVQRPRILSTAHAMDFGAGFYTTTDSRQGVRFARLRMRQARATGAHVSVYEFHECAAPALRTLRFPSPDGEWLRFVRNNRMLPGYAHDFDLVVGPVADDRVNDTLAEFSEGCDEAALLAKLLTQRLTDQWLFHTECALRCLTFKGVKDVR